MVKGSYSGQTLAKRLETAGGMRKGKRNVLAQTFFQGFCFMALIFHPAISSGQKVTAEDGIPIVHNPKEPIVVEGAPTQLMLKQDLLIGQEAGDESYMFSELRSVQVDDQENIYVLDWKDISIKIFDKTGKHLRTFGKKGQGPGEIQTPTRMLLTPGGKLAILDSGNRRIAFYSLTGECLKEIPTAKWSLIRMSVDSRSYIYGDSFAFGKDRLLEKLLKFGSEFDLVSTVHEVSAELRPPRVNPLPERFIYSVMKGDNFVWGITTKYELQIVNPQGEPVRRVVKDYDPVRISEKDKEKMIRENYGEKGAPPDIALEWPTNYPPMYSLLIDDQDRIIVRTNATDARGNSRYDVFGPDGVCCLAFTLTEREIPMVVKKDKMYCLIQENEAGIPQVKRYAMDWK
jgi:hypothetical protein